jgi:DNA polymerase III subunit chi
MIVDFYPLGAAPIERVLPSLCEKVLAGGERLLVVAEEEELLARLDEQLWSYKRDSFLPHGRERPEAQPVLLSTEPEPLNGATHIALADGSWREAALAFARTLYLFGGDRLDEARALWRALKADPAVEPRSWKQRDGQWVEGP